MKGSLKVKTRYKLSPIEEQVTEWYEEHLNGMTLEQLTEKYSKTRKFFIHHFKAYSLPVIVHRKSWRLKDTSSLKYRDFFDVIDNELKAYLLGFFTADGSIAKDDKTIQVTSNDVYILNLFRDNIGPELELIQGTAKSFIFSCNCKEIVKALQALGLCNRKSYCEINMPPIPAELLRHYIRGVFDGDGWCSVGIAKDGSCYRVAGICGNSIVFLKQLEQVLNHNQIETSWETREDKLYKILVRKMEAFKLLHKFLYKDAHFYLQRKHDKIFQGALIPSKFRKLKEAELRRA